MRKARAGGRREPGRSRLARLLPAALLGVWAVARVATPVHATRLDFIPVGDPIEQELRLLDLAGVPGSATPRFRLPHAGIRPLQRLEIQGAGSPEPVGGPAAISLARLERAIARDAATGFAPHPTLRSTPRVLERGTEDGRFETSLGLEGGAELDEGGRRFGSGSGLHGRVAVQVDRWLAYTHLLVGQVENARTFADPIVPENDLIVHTEESYLAAAGASGSWNVLFGRGRWHWGPGEEGSLVLSKTSAPITALAYHLRIEALGADATALSAALDPAAGEHLAAHRLEWQPAPALRLGLTEAARYHASGWTPLYVIGAIPYVLVQRLEVQDEPDSLGAHRNNILVGFDAAWRIAPGTRIYAEGLIDDLHARTANNPNKYGFQLGWEGVGMLGPSRLSWSTEYTRLTRFVYTSFFGRAYEAQGRPLGYPTGPDSRRIRVRGTWDLDSDWQVEGRAARTDHGENALDEPFLPGSPSVTVSRFEGVVEQTREADLALRWWPASGVDLRARGGYRWIENPAHVAGARDEGAYGTIEVRLTR